MEKYTVQGQITDTKGNSLKGLKVIANDARKRSTLKLGEVLTDSQGKYLIIYSPNLLQLLGLQQIDIQVKVFDPLNAKILREYRMKI